MRSDEARREIKILNKKLADKDLFKQTEAQRNNDMLLLDFFRMKEGRELSFQVSARIGSLSIQTDSVLR
jgi:hypothetical protein